MRSKEAIRNRILSYTHLIWGTKKIEQQDALVQIIIEGLVNELYLAQNKLQDIDIRLDEKLVCNLTDEIHFKARPAHTIIQITPSLPMLELSRYSPFILSKIPASFKSQNSAAIFFHPVNTTRLFNVKINYLFHQHQLFGVNADNKKQLICTTEKKLSYHSVWIGLDIDSTIDDLEGLSFYLDFPTLSEISPLYDVLSYTECKIGGKVIRLRQDYSVRSDSNLLDSDQDILDLYRDHYLTFDEHLQPSDISMENLPMEINTIINQEKNYNLKPAHWIKLEFSPVFDPNDLKNMVIAINAFPISNKKIKKQLLMNGAQTATIVLDKEEKLLSVDSVKENNGRAYSLCASFEDSQPGNYWLKTANRLFSNDFNVSELVGLLLDKLEDDKTAFSDFDIQKTTDLLTSILITEQEALSKLSNSIESNSDNILTHIFINPYKTTTSVDILSWVTYGECLNGIQAGFMFMSDKNSGLDGRLAISLCEFHGAKEITDIEELKAINHFHLNSRGDIITEDDIISFCKSELGKKVKHVTFELTVQESIKPSEGVIRMLEVGLIVTPQQLSLIHRKGVLKSLTTGLKKRSPADYNYTIKLVAE